MKNILITGATGFLGSYLLKRFLDDKDAMPIVLARGKKGESPAKRVEGTLKYFYRQKADKAMLKRIRIVEGQIDKESLGIDAKTLNNLIKEVDEIYHSAAIAEFRIPLDVIRKANVDGARNVFDFAMECKKNGRLKKVNHISTTFIAGTRRGIFYENELDVHQKFNNTYEQSKFEAEILARDYRKKGLVITVFRPSILTGDWVSGKTSNFKMLYRPLHFFATELFESVPANAETKVNLIPVDIVARAIYLIASEKDSANKTYHMSNPTTIGLGHFIDLASDFFGFKKPELVPEKYFDMKRLSVVQRALIEPYIPYFNYELIFDSKMSQETLGRKGFSYPVIDDDFLIKLFRHCRECGFIKPTRQYVTAG